MAARGPSPDAPLAAPARRRLPHRGTVLAAATLCVLAMLAGAVAHSAGIVHHHHHAALAATVTGADGQGTHARGTPDLAAPAGAAADPVRAVVNDTAVVVSLPASTSADAERTRGPPAITG